MRIELSPGDWAGVYTCVREQARALRREAGTDPILGGELLAQAEDLDRVAASMRVQIANGAA